MSAPQEELPNGLQDDEIVITGISGRYPNANNVHILMERLMNKENCCKCDYSISNPKLPKNTGQMPNYEYFDCDFFGMDPHSCINMEPMMRVLLQHTFEAILDAGLHPDDLKETKTGVFSGTCFSDDGFYKYDGKNRSNILNHRTMLPQRICYILNLDGPAYNCDTACSSGMYAFEEGYRAIREGRCETALIVAANMVVNQNVTMQFRNLGVLNNSTGCRPFDENASGYTRSGGAVAAILQKRCNAKRIYSEIIHGKTNCDGWKEVGITFPSADCQATLLREVLSEAKVNPREIKFIEAHGTGTRVGDPEELNAIDKVFKPTQKEPLLIGSIKSNIGHSEGVSAMCSISKGIFMFNFDKYMPNIHYDNPRKDVPALIEGRMKVVTEVEKLPEDTRIIGINCFGFGGANGNVLLRKYGKVQEKPKYDLPRLICFSARSKDAIKHFQEKVLQISNDFSAIRLLQEAFRKPFLEYTHRSFIILDGPNTKMVDRNQLKDLTKSVGLAIGNSSSYSYETLCQFLRFPDFQKTFLEIKSICKNNGIEPNANNKNSDIPDTMFSTIIMRISILNILIEKLKLDFANIYGVTPMGKLLAKFAKKQINLTEVVLTACALSYNNMSKNSIGHKLTKELFENQNDSMVPAPKRQLILNIDADEIRGLKLITPGSTINSFLEVIGQLYLEGFYPQIQNLYDDISLPVGRGTSMLAPLIKWNEKKFIKSYRISEDKVINEVIIDLGLSEAKFYGGHILEDRVLCPATGYIYLVMQSLSHYVNCDIYDMKVVFENVRFVKPTHITDRSVTFIIPFTKGGFFEVTENDSVVATGFVQLVEENELCSLKRPKINIEDEDIQLFTKDVYKELKLRGYNYKGEFKSIERAGVQCAQIKWEENWVTYLDNILQLSILKTDSRGLYVPVGIERLFIDCPGHISHINSIVEDPKLVNVYLNPESQTLGNDYVEFRGVHAKAIQKRRQRLLPILETHKFIPNHFKCSIDASTRINVQLLLIACPSFNFKSIETKTGFDFNEDGKQYISSYICEALADLPLVLPEVSVLSYEDDLQIENVTVVNAMTKDNLLFVGPLSDLDTAFNATNAKGFVMAFGSSEEQCNDDRFVIFTQHQVENFVIYLLHKKQSKATNTEVIDISNFENIDVWLPKVQKAMKESEEVILLAQNDPNSGIMGFVNCVRREPNGTKARCVFLLDKDANFNLNDPFYKNQLEKGMPNNILKDGQWGTYKHLLLPNNGDVLCKHIYANCHQYGDLSSLKWFQGPGKTKESIKVAYSALNFRDLMLAYGKITPDAVCYNRFEQEDILGLEFSGYSAKGEKIMGMSKGAISNLVTRQVQMKCPDEWSLEDAATVTTVYCTCINGLIQKAELSKGQSILIHSACGGIGLAAINICTYYECDIFVTVGTEEKREYLLKNHPNIKKEHIGNSRDTSFREMIMRCTKGRGVDIVLNSLADEKLKASLDCVARGGSFVEIGKYDMEMNTHISMEFANREVNFIAVLLDRFFENKDNQPKMEQQLTRAAELGFLIPLPRTIFSMNELEKAFRFMSTGKHIGKILIKIDAEAKELLAAPKYSCDPKKSYIVIGGMGGFGLELVDWLILRGAKNVVISSRNGAQSGYQKFRLSLWKSYNVNVSVCTEDVMFKKGCEKLILEATKMGSVDGIFNLAVVLQDCILENQTVETMRTSYGPKALLTQHLNELSRKMCPELRHFVVFSSVSCGRGNGGQVNYGLSNSVMERICELRRKDNLPGHAIQWGAIGDVGILEELQKESNEIAIGGTLQQKIANCLEVFDQLIQSDEAILSSIIVAEKFGGGGTDNPVEAVAKILGIKNIKSISMHAPLTELGMDSMMGVEIKQTLERDFDIDLNANDIRTLTFAKLEDIASGDLQPGSGAGDVQYGLNLLAPYLHLNESKETVLSINENSENSVIGFPGIEGTPDAMLKMSNVVNIQIKIPHYTVTGTSAETLVDETANAMFNIFANEIRAKKTFKIICHSFGCLPAMKFISDVETKLGAKGIIVFIDSAPLLMKEMIKLLDTEKGNILEANVLEYILTKLKPNVDKSQIKENSLKMQKLSYPDRFKFLSETYKLNDSDKEMFSTLMNSFHQRLLSVTHFQTLGLEHKIQSKVFLYKPKTEIIMAIANNYDLNKWCEKVTVKKFDGSHQTILENDEMLKHLKTDLCL